MKKLSTNDVTMHNVFALIVGSSGVGKTSLAKTLDPKETLIISAESGLLSIAGTGIDVWQIENVADLKEAVIELQNGAGYKNIFIDSLTEIAEQIFADLKPNFTKAQTFGLYDEYSTRFIWLIKKLRDLTDYNIICTCLDKLVAVDGIDRTSIDLIQKSLTKKIPAFFDEVFHYQIIPVNEENKRCIITSNEHVDFCKDRSGKLNWAEPADLNKIFNKIKGE